MNKSSYLAIACVVLLLVGGIYYFVKEEAISSSPPPAQEASSESPGGLSYVGNTIVEERDGKRVWELTADNIEVDSQTKHVRLKNLKGIFYQDNGGKIDITSAQAELDSQTQDVVMESEVKAISSNGATFTAQKARWDGKGRHFFGSDGIKFTRDDTVITGDKIDSDANMEKIKVQGNARVVKGGSPSEQTKQ